MASSDEEDEALPLSVSNYHIEDDENEPVSLSVLPILWKESERTDDRTMKLFLRGNADGGLHRIHKHVVAWRFNLSNVNKPEISVLSKEKNWFKLEKPRKVFEGTIRSILVTVQSLHYMQKNPESSKKSLMDHLSKTFSSYEVGPSDNDLHAHKSIIAEAVERIDALRKAKFLVEFLKEPLKKGVPDEGVQAKLMTKFIVSDSDDDDSNDGGEDDEAEEEGLFDSACCICDNGGELLCCEGSCLRSFHANVDDAEDCETLGFSKAKVNALATQEFLCDNCKYKKHQCFACGRLGSSDKYSGAEVFRCVNATCGHFYHPHCVAKMLHPEDKEAAEAKEKNIVKGESFICPVHRCYVCKQGENKKDSQFQFALCRRCPKSYHRKCLPRKISFTTIEEEGIVQRAWEDLLPNRILIYCLKHEIVEDVGTPIRNHIRFPRVEEKKSVIVIKRPVFDEKKKKKTDSVGHGNKIDLKRKVHVEEPRQERTAPPLKKIRKLFSGQSSGRLTSGSSSIPNKMVKKVDYVAKKDPKSILGNKIFESVSEPLDQEEQHAEDDDVNTEAEVKPDKHFSSRLDPDSKKRVLDIMKSVEASVTIETIRANQTRPSTNSLKYFDEKAITQGKVEASVQAIREAVRILDHGGSIADAEEVCGRGLVEQIHRWRFKLKNHIGPFLIGRRYTSYGRHFTKPEKIQEIVNRLHPYLQDGDTLVDFSCGSNDFSVFMDKKLKEVGKKCFFKNYDIFPPTQDFNVEIRDWMGVEAGELPAGSKLVIGLNPPFGVRGGKAWQFIEKALEFSPKLLVIIAPPETPRLDEKKYPYDLIWEDDRLLSGKAFYLPGSINASDKQMDQWCTTPPLLYLWSHQGWSAKHCYIAKSQAHIPKTEPSGITQFKHEPDLPTPDLPPNPIDEAQLNDDPIRSPDHIEAEVVKSEEEFNEIAEIAVPEQNDRPKRDRVSKKNKRRAYNRVSPEPRYDEIVDADEGILLYYEDDNVIVQSSNEATEEIYLHSSRELSVHGPSPVYDAGMPSRSTPHEDLYCHYYDNTPAVLSPVREIRRARSSSHEGMYGHSYGTPAVGMPSYGGEPTIEEIERKYLVPEEDHRLARFTGNPGTGYGHLFTGQYSPSQDTRFGSVEHIPTPPPGYEMYGVGPAAATWHHNRISNFGTAPAEPMLRARPDYYAPPRPVPYGNPGGPRQPGPGGRYH